MFDRMSIRVKILVLSATIITISFIIGVIGIVSLVLVNNEHKRMLETAESRLVYSYDGLAMFTTIKEHVYLMANNGIILNDKDYEKYNEQVDKILTLFDTYIANLDGDSSVTDENRKRLEGDVEYIASSITGDYAAYVDAIYNACKAGNKKVVEDNINIIVEQSDKITDTFSDMVQAAIDKRDVMTEENDSYIITTIVVIVVFLLISLIGSVIFASFISGKIVKPVKKLVAASEKIAQGELDATSGMRSNGRDEVSVLSNDFSDVADNISGMIEDIENVIVRFGDGSITARANTDKYKGAYRRLMSSLNNLIEMFVENNNLVIRCVNAYGKGDFEFEMPRLPGDLAVMHETMDELKDNLKGINNALKETINDVSQGNFDIKLNSSEFEGDWAVLIGGLNSLVDSVAEPIRDLTKIIESIAAADFTRSVDESKYKGEFKIIAKSMNNCSSTLMAYIRDISDNLDRLARQDLNINVGLDYIGDFSSIKESMELVIDNFNKLIREISASSEQVALGSKSIADSSLTLAQGATEQANAVEELTATVRDVAERTSENAKKSSLARDLAIEAQNSAQVVNDEMKNMLVAMDEINQASNNISNIIKAIDDIAFQTNILALNAAVEAARAGEHGKGFAVVAEEVRNLAARSQQSAKETSELISTSLAKAEQGSDIANSTAETLKSITEQIARISEISSEVAVASEKQNAAISEVNIGISQISDVVANNTATSEESAAASEELASQSALFRETILRFNLK